MTDEIDHDALQRRLPEGWDFDPFYTPDPHYAVAGNYETDTKLRREVMIEVEYADHDHYHTRYWASYSGEHPLPNVGAEEESVETDTLAEAVDQAIAWAEEPP